MILIDTHVWLWLNNQVDRLSSSALTLLSTSDEIYLSAASAWEIAVKWASGKLPLPVPPKEYIPSRMTENGIRSLPIHHRHALRLAALPLHHKDPFDRILVAQAQVEGLKLMTADRGLASYEVEILWADRN